MKHGIRSVVLGACVAVFLFGEAVAGAQVTTGNIIGVARDESNALLPGVTATLVSPALPGGPLTSVTNGQGEYRFSGLQPGSYALKLEMQGFATYEEIDLRVL